MSLLLTGAGSASASAAVPAPVNTVLPSITGTAMEGQTLTGSTGTWTGSPTYSYQWKRAGAAIDGATASTYLLVSADVGSTITVTVTATNAGGSASATSAGVSVVDYYREDTFGRSDSASSLGSPSDGGSTWQTSGTWGVASNKGYNPGANSQSTVVLESGQADCEVRVTLSTVSGTGTAAPCCRWTDASNNYLIHATATSLDLYKREAGSFSLIAGVSPRVVANGDVLTLWCYGTRIELYQNDTYCLGTTNSFNAAATQHGLRSDLNSSGRIGLFRVVPLTARRLRIVADGNSQVSGAGGQTPWPTPLFASFPANYVVASNAFGVGGQTTADMVADAGTQVAPLMLAHYRNLVVFDEVINDIYFGATAAEAYANLQAYSAIVRGVNGSKLVVLAPQPDRGDFPGTSTLPGANAAAQRAEFQSRVAAFMALLGDGSGVCDAVCDLTGDVRYTDVTDATYYLADLVHRTTALHSIVATALKTTIDSLTW